MFKLKFPKIHLGNPFKFRPKFDKKKFTWKKVKFYGLRVLIGLAVFIVLLFAWFAKDLPTPGKIKNMQMASETKIFDRNGKPIYALSGDIKRDVISSGDIPQNVKNATISAEDHTFYTNHGISLKSIARAAYTNITNHGISQGGSTITQQYVKNALLDPSQRTFTRKIKELILTLEIEVMYNKDQILTMYLNEIPYGGNSYGIQAASKTYFNKDAKDLTLAEAATLAALPQRPTYYSPYGTHGDRRLVRVDYVLDSMVSLKYTSPADAEKAKEEVKNITFAEPHQYIVAPHFVQYVKDELVAKYGEQMVEEGGLKVTTTLDLDKQVQAEKAVTDAASGKFNNINASNAALVSIDPKTGQILAMVGSVDYFNNDIDGQVNVADSLRQPGSSFKPVVYATAFKGKYDPAYTLWDVSTDFGGGYRPVNYDGTTHGPVSMRQALSNSLNIPAVKTLELAGVDNSLRTAHDMGITSLNDSPDKYGLSLVLGSGEVKLIDLTTAYGVFANNGNLSPTTPIMKVIDSKGKTLDEYKDGQGKKEVLDPQIAFEISSILSDNDARSMVFGSRSALYFPDRTVAVKTGTTSLYKDAWTLGYTPSVVTGVWVGNNDGTPMTAGAAGAMAAAPIFHQYMASVLGDSPNEDFPQPKGISDVTVDKLSNKLPTANSPQTITDIFSSWQVPKDHDDIHVTLRVDKFSGNLATDECPDQFIEMKTYTDLHSEEPDKPNWEGPVRAIAEAMGININYPPKDKSCVGMTGAPTIKITSPANNATVSSGFTIQTNASSPVGIRKVDFSVDGVYIGSATSSPYSFTTPNLSSGQHSIAAVVTNETGLSASDQETVNVNKDTTSPGAPNFKSINQGAANLTIYWTNPSDGDLDSIRIYGSQNKGQIGDLLKTVSAVNTFTTVNGLQSGKTYWITLKAVDSSGNESTDDTQYSGMPL